MSNCRVAVNFINVKRTNFLYEHHVLAAFSTYMYIEKQRSYEKFIRKMLMKLTLRRFLRLGVVDEGMCDSKCDWKIIFESREMKCDDLKWVSRIG
jgi:hypothetical protein